MNTPSSILVWRDTVFYLHLLSRRLHSRFMTSRVCISHRQLQYSPSGRPLQNRAPRLDHPSVPPHPLPVDVVCSGSGYPQACAWCPLEQRSQSVWASWALVPSSAHHLLPRSPVVACRPCDEEASREVEVVACT